MTGTDECFIKHSLPKMTSRPTTILVVLKAYCIQQLHFTEQSKFVFLKYLAMITIVFAK